MRVHFSVGRWIFVLILMVAASGFAQNGTELFGYFESQIMGVIIEDQLQQLTMNKLRVDLKYDPSERLTFAANFDYITTHGKTRWNILQFLSSSVTHAIPEHMRGFYVIPFSDRHFLDNAYIKMAFRHFDLTAGKQQISLGSGYVWNPTDVFNIKDVLDPTYEQPGHNAVRLDVPLGNACSVTALYSPGESWKQSAKLIQLKARIPRFDVTFIGIETLWRFHDYTQFDVNALDFLELPQKRSVLGGSLEGELLGLGLWTEYGYSLMENSDDFYELVAGMNYTFDFQTFVMLEYYRNTLCSSDFTQYTLNDWMRYFAAEQKAVSRDQVYALIQHPVTDFMDLGLMSIVSISDGSLALVPTLNWSFSENLDIMAYANVNFGKEGTAYSRITGSGGLLRARVYF
jgi:hypothetical protein